MGWLQLLLLLQGVCGLGVGRCGVHWTLGSPPLQEGVGEGEGVREKEGEGEKGGKGEKERGGEGEKEEGTVREGGGINE